MLTVCINEQAQIIFQPLQKLGILCDPFQCRIAQNLRVRISDQCCDLGVIPSLVRRTLGKSIHFVLDID